MIIYAYYGLGKTTLCKKNPDLFIDVDEEYVMPKFNQNLDAVKDYILEINKQYQCKHRNKHIELFYTPNTLSVNGFIEFT